MAAPVRADVLDGTSAPRDRMGRALRSQSRSQRDRRPRRTARVRSAFVQRPRRDAILRGRGGPRRTDSDWQVRRARRHRTIPRSLRSGPPSLRGAPHLIATSAIDTYANRLQILVEEWPDSPVDLLALSVSRYTDMVATFYGYQPGTRNEGCQVGTRTEGYHLVAAD